MTVDAGPLPHKDYVLPEVDLSMDEGDPDYDGRQFVPIEGSHCSRWVCPPGVHRNAWNARQADWADRVAAYEAQPGDFYSAWMYLNCHPAFWAFDQGGSTEHPSNHISRLEGHVGFDRSIEVWPLHDEESGGIYVTIEAGKRELIVRDGPEHWHDPDLDTCEPTYEQAVIVLARKVWESYGNDRRVCDADV